MHGNTGKMDVSQSNRTYSSRLGSRDGAVIKTVWLKQIFPGGYDAQRAAWSSATLQKWDIVDDHAKTDLQSAALENKIADKFVVSKSGNRYSTKVGSRNGACISSLTVHQEIYADAVI